jgi:16S rRNA processing protein RimM
MDKNRSGSGEQTETPEPRFLAIGRVVNAHGIRGELKVEILTDDPQRFELLSDVWIGLDGEEPLSIPIQSYRLHKRHLLLKLEGCDSRNAADTYRGLLIQIPMEEALPLADDEYYEHQVIGLAVWTVSGEHLGQVDEIIFTGANDVYVVRSGDRPRHEILIPFLANVVLEIDLNAGRMVVELPEGLPR